MIVPVDRVEPEFCSVISPVPPLVSVSRPVKFGSPVMFELEPLLVKLSEMAQDGEME